MTRPIYPTLITAATALSLALAAALGGQAAAEDGVERIAYDYCYVDYWNDSPSLWCQIVVADPEGSHSVIVADGVDPVWSPDGSRIAFNDGSDEVVVLDVGDGTIANVSNHPAADISPAWSPDGLQLVFQSNREGTFELYVMSSNGAGVTRLTDSGFSARPAWSPDGMRIAFDCMVESANVDICAINPDGTNVVRLTTDPALDSTAAFSPDGTRIAFATTRYGSAHIAVMNADGSGVSPLGVAGTEPAWSPNGTRIAFTIPFGGSCEADGRLCYDYVGIINADDTGFRLLASGSHPTWTLSTQNLRPVPWFEYACSGPTCDFQSLSSDPDGAIASHSWDFGDGTTGSNATVSHTYAAAGTYTVTLTVTDDEGATGSLSRSVEIVNTPPVAAFDAACSVFSCSFNASGSSDADGTIVSYAWNFGDATTGSGPTPIHTYAAAGAYTVTLMVKDNGGALATESKTVTVTQAFMHVGDLDEANTNQGGTWTAIVTITVEDSNHSPVANATVGGGWSNGATASCTTNGSGLCTVSQPAIPKRTHSVAFTVVNVTHATLTYKAADNHDPDGDSSGTSITISRP